MRVSAPPSPRPSLRSRWRVALASLCLAWSALACGEAIQRNFFFQTINTEHGLAQSTVTAFLQDRLGFIWIGTSSGLQQYDGYGFNTFQHSGDDPDSPPEGPVSALAEDDAGNIWIGCFGPGLLRHSPATGVFRQMSPGGEIGNVRALLFDPRNGLWVGSDAGVQLVDPADGHVKRRLPLGQDGRAGRLTDLGLDGAGNLWVASTAGLLRLAAGADALQRVAADPIDAAAGLLLGHDRILYAATPQGVYRIDGDDATQVWPATGHDSVGALAQDARGRLWLAVPQHGLAVFDPHDGRTQWLAPGAGVGNLPDAAIISLHVDRSGLLWIGTMERGITKVDPNGTLFRYVVDREAVGSNTASDYVRALLVDVDRGLWRGTEGGGLKR